jgi:hypothetical protein
MLKNNTYQEFASYTVKELPTEAVLADVVESLYFEAALNMGTNIQKKDNARDISRICYLIRTDFNYLPLPVVASAFIKGSLGKLDPGRLIPRTVFTWLTEVAGDYRREQDHKAIQESMKEKPVSFDLHKFPVGKAIIQKITWLQSGAIDEDGWDRIPLKDLAERIASGLPAVPELFGVKTKKRNNE